MRRIVAALVLAGAALATSPVAAHAVPVGVTNDHGCYSVWIEAKTIPLFCVSQG